MLSYEVPVARALTYEEGGGSYVSSSATSETFHYSSSKTSPYGNNLYVNTSSSTANEGYTDYQDWETVENQGGVFSRSQHGSASHSESRGRTDNWVTPSTWSFSASYSSTWSYLYEDETSWSGETISMTGSSSEVYSETSADADGSTTTSWSTSSSWSATTTGGPTTSEIPSCFTSTISHSIGRGTTTGTVTRDCLSLSTSSTTVAGPPGFTGSFRYAYYTTGTTTGITGGGPIVTASRRVVGSSTVVGDKDSPVVYNTIYECDSAPEVIGFAPSAWNGALTSMQTASKVTLAWTQVNELATIDAAHRDLSWGGGGESWRTSTASFLQQSFGVEIKTTYSNQPATIGNALEHEAAPMLLLPVSFDASTANGNPFVSSQSSGTYTYEDGNVWGFSSGTMAVPCWPQTSGEIVFLTGGTGSHYSEIGTATKGAAGDYLSSQSIRADHDYYVDYGTTSYTTMTVDGHTSGGHTLATTEHYTRQKAITRRTLNWGTCAYTASALAGPVWPWGAYPMAGATGGVAICPKGEPGFVKIASGWTADDPMAWPIWGYHIGGTGTGGRRAALEAQCPPALRWAVSWTDAEGGSTEMTAHARGLGSAAAISGQYQIDGQRESAATYESAAEASGANASRSWVTGALGYSERAQGPGNFAWVFRFGGQGQMADGAVVCLPPDRYGLTTAVVGGATQSELAEYGAPATTRLDSIEAIGVEVKPAAYTSISGYGAPDEYAIWAFKPVEPTDPADDIGTFYA